MGIALGLGIIFGVRAVELSPTGILPVIALLLATAIVTSASVRNLCLVAGLGCLLGVSAGMTRIAEETALLRAAPDGVIVGEIESDLDVWESGSMARFTWRDAENQRRRSMLFLPPALLVGRGDVIEVFGQVSGAEGELVFADAARLVDRAGAVELRRRAAREYLTGAIQRRVPGTPGALTLGLLIGDDTALTASERDVLRQAGLSHLTAVSGWNVTLVTSAVGLLFLRLGMRGWGWTSLQLIALVGFVWIVGLEPPVTRAAIMAVAGLVAIRAGRPAHSVTILTLSAALMVAVSPAALTSLSFQLSVLATLGLVVAARLTSRVEGLKSVALTPLAATAVIGLITAPLLAAAFGTLSLLTIPANLVAAPLIPAATIAGVLVIAAGPLNSVSVAAGWIAWILSAFVLWLSRALSALPYGYHEFAPLSDPAQAALYAALLVVVVLVLPEGRLMVRGLSDWVCRDPLAATLSASAGGVALLAATFSV